MGKRKFIIVGITAMLVLVMIFISSAYAAATISVNTPSTPTSYFEVYTGSDWGGQSAPFHETSDGRVAYCLNEKANSPSGGGTSYSSTDIMSSFTSTESTGLKIILEEGYPLGKHPSNISDSQARYATANAIRFWLRENGETDAFYNYENLGSISSNDLISEAATGKVGTRLRVSDDSYIPVLQYCMQLLVDARSQDLPDHSISFSPTSVNLTFNGTSFVGTATVSGNDDKYALTSIPADVDISGSTGKIGEKISISIPATTDTTGDTFSVGATGYDDAVPANIFAINPGNSNYQPVVVGNSSDVDKDYEVQAGTGTLKLVAPSIADLTITSLTTDQSTYEVNDTVTVTATVKNQGKAAANNFVVRLTSSPSVTTQNTTISLAAGAATNVTYTFTAPYYTSDTNIALTATADATGVITELNNSNNTKSTSITVTDGRPDLDITSFTTDSTSYDYGDTVTVTAVVKNLGDTTANNFIVRLTTSPTTATHNKTVTSLAAGAITTLTYTFTAPYYDTNTSMTLSAFADSTDVVDEINEGNNTASTSITITSGKPDLDITSITTDSSTYDYNDTVTVTAVVKNIGHTTASNFYVRLSTTPSTGIQYKTVTSLTAGSSTTITYTFSAPLFTVATNMTLVTMADSADTVDESNESNNTASKVITINPGTTDLTITSLSTDASSYDYGDTVTVTAVVKNLGNSSANNFVVQLTTSPATSTQNKTVATLAAGASTTLTYTFAAPLYSANTNMTITAVADVNDVVNETNESNNTATKSITILSGLPDLTITSLSTDASSYDYSDTVTVTAVIKNLGHSTATNFVVRLTTSPATSTQNKTVTSLAAGASTTLTYTFAAPLYATNTNMTITAVADVTDVVDETNESNNTATKSITINAGQPDLTISSLSTDSINYDYGDTVTVTAVVKNQGYNTASNFIVRLVTSPATSTQNKTVISLAAGASTTLTYTFTAPLYTSLTSMTLTASADATSVVTEMSETNNTATANITINAGYPDLTITNISSTKAVYNPGDTVSVSVTVKNQGYLTASNCAVSLGTTPATATQTQSISTLAPGASTVLTYTFISPAYQSPTTMMLTATADPLNAIVELNETNNAMSMSIKINTAPTVGVSCDPSEVSDDDGKSTITVTLSDPDNDNLSTTLTIQPMGMSNNSPGTLTTLYTGQRASGSGFQVIQNGLKPGYYRVVASVIDTYGLTATASATIHVSIKNIAPQVTLVPDKPSYAEGETANISVRCYDAKGDQLSVTLIYQDMGELGASPLAAVTDYQHVYQATSSYTIPQDVNFVYQRIGMVPHLMKITVTAVDPGGLSDTQTIILNTTPKPIDGQVTHTDLWEQHRQTYNNWAINNGMSSLVRPPELFFRGERFVLSAQTSRYLQSNYVTVTIAEHPECHVNLTTTDGYNWTGYIWDEEMDEWPAQSLSFVFKNQYVDGTVTQDTVVVRIDTVDYFLLHMLY